MTAPVLVMAGGTGGHVFPALAVAECLRERGVPVHWLGTRRGIEASVVPAAGFPIHFIDVAGLRGKGLVSLVMAPLHLLRALLQSLGLLRRLAPAVVLGMGGFAAGPGGLAAWLLRKPLVIHEQNAVAGTTNRLLAHLARRVLSGYPNVLHFSDNHWVGNPVRRPIAELPSPEARWLHRRPPLHLLVLGGSLGAQPINEQVPAAISTLPEESRPMVRHQAGRAHAESTAARYRACGVAADVSPFIEDMAEAYAWADLVICRAGALTIAELTAAGVGALMVPLPHAIDDHQTANARWLSDAGAGELLQQSALTPEFLASLIERVQREPEVLLNWARVARALAKPQATDHVADVCLEVAHG